MNRLAIVLALLLMIPVSALADVDFGGQLMYGDDADLAVGGRVEIDTPELQENSRIALDFNWFFPDDPPGANLTFWTANMNWLQRQGWLICHASALVYKDKGFGIAGFSGGGKSTLMLHLMANPEMSYLTNDRLFIHNTAEGVLSRGIPKLPRVNWIEH